MIFNLGLALLQTGAGALSSVEGWVPYLIVVAIGAVVGLAEIIATFSATPILALRTGWAWALVALNGGTAALALWIVTRFLPAPGDPLLVALAVGLGFPALIRTNFVLAKSLQGTEGQALSLNLSWVYQQFQNLARTQIDLALVSRRQRLLRLLLEKHSQLKKLAEIAQYLIQERALLSQQEVAKMQQYVESVQASQTLSEQLKRVTLARFILETGGPGYVRELLREPSKAGD